MKAGIIGATGYTGQELTRLLMGHPEAELVYLGSSSSAGQDYEGMFPQFAGRRPGVLQDEEVPELDVLFCALPHGLTAGRTRAWLERGIRVIDLGADFRLKDSAVYEAWYDAEHPDKELIAEAVYGLPELNRTTIRGKTLVANPGCYPTASILALAPLLKAGLIESRGIIIDAKSGVSGAGRSARTANLYSEVNENFKAYGVGGHRHTPEIEQLLSEAAGEALILSFTPHLVPMTRGILITAYADLKGGADENALKAAWQEQYEGEPFVHILPKGIWPQTKFASGTNHAFLQCTVDKRSGKAIIVSVIDNLIKGAAGQAVQNMNILYDLPEETGLEAGALWP